ncbi:hypothetical protein ABKN59_006616 [Abortiporus biennis]
MAPIVALTLPSARSEDPCTTLERSFSETNPSCMISWSLDSESKDSTYGLSQTPQGVALGCEDGTIYMFRAPKYNGKGNPSISTTLIPELIDISRPSSPLRYSSLGLTKSRVVSGVSTEPVEAPKNYVDFDEEPERLKDMLRGKGVKDKTVMDSLLSGVEKNLSVERPNNTGRSTPAKAGTKKRDDLLSTTTHSTAPSVTSLSSPPSPALLPQFQFSDKEGGDSWTFCHIFPPQNQPVTEMANLDGGKYLVCIQEKGNLYVYAKVDGSCVAASASDDDSPSIQDKGLKVRTTLPTVWTWKHLRVISVGESQFIFAMASSELTESNTLDYANGDSELQTRIVGYEFIQGHDGDPDSTYLDRVCDWTFDGPVKGVDLHLTDSGQMEIFHVTSFGHFIKQQVTLVEKAVTPENNAQNSGSSVHLPLPNYLKGLTSRSTDHIPDEEKAESRDNEKLRLSEEIDIGGLALSGPVLSIRTMSSLDCLRGVLWSNKELCGFEYRQNSLRNLFSSPLSGICEIKWSTATSFTVLFKDHAEIYHLVDGDDNNDVLTPKVGHQSSHNTRPKLVHSASLLPSDERSITTEGHILTTRVKRGQRRIEFTTINSSLADTVSNTLWRPKTIEKNDSPPPRITAILPLELLTVILGYGDGYVRKTTLNKLSNTPTGGQSPDVASNVPLNGNIVTLHLVQDTRTWERLIVGGADDGSIAIWNQDSLKLLARWVVFTVPLTQVIYLNDGRLRGCIFCIAEDGATAVIALDGYQFLFLIPAAVAPLKKLCLGEDNLLLYYSDHRVRLWDVKTREFWRSMSTEKAQDLLNGGGWTEWSMEKKPSTVPKSFSTLRTSYRAVDGSATLLFDVEAFLVQLGLHAPSFSPGETSLNGQISSKLEQVKAALSLLVTTGINNDIDRLCKDKMGMSPSNIGTGCVSRHGVTILYASPNARTSWSLSRALSAAKASAIVALLDTLLLWDASIPDAETVTAFYTTALGSAIGEPYRPPDLSILAKQWLDATINALRHSSRLLTDAGIARLSDEETIRLADIWQTDLPILQPDVAKTAVRAALSLFICGSIAIQRYTLLPSNVLTDIAKSISLYLNDEASPYRGLAIDLCSRGFPIWQQHVDAVQMLRALFILATTAKKESISVLNVGLQARTAILHIASNNTPLFMTTLSMDILHPQSLQHRKSVMQLVVFLIRKKPLILYSNLPRLVEAVVKSLDPNSTASREAVMDSATEILGHIVRCFPTVDFHMATQRLAVGTSEGAVVMYDLKTATRLYVLEGHKKRTTACSFSPDGRRLVTVSLDECAVLVWKVGSSFSSFFNPGAPPRQGHGGSEPFKTLNFNVGDAANMPLATTLEAVKFEWTAERSVKLKIKDSVLTFST